jgi:uncharacterized protein (DUF2384 family)
MALTASAPLNEVITQEGRVDIKSLARAIDVSIPSIARTFGLSARYLNGNPTAKSLQPRALQIVSRLNSLAEVLGGTKFAIAWVNTPTPELGGKSAIQLITSGIDREFDIALQHIDSYLAMDPD